MVWSSCAQSCLVDEKVWANLHFGKADLGDRRRTRRLVEVAAAMAQNPNMSLPKQLPDWSDLLGAYRFLSNMAVNPSQILAPHVQWVRAAASACPVVLCLQDTTTVDLTFRTGISGLGMIGNGGGRGLLQHSALAVDPAGRNVLGVLDLAWHAVKRADKKETRKQRLARWTTSDVWQDAAEAIGAWPAGSTLVHVGDRHADLFRFMAAVMELGHQFVVRAMHDRNVSDASGDPCVDESETLHLWDKMGRQPELGRTTVQIQTQRDRGNKVKRTGRSATLSIRTARVKLPNPPAESRRAGSEPLQLWAIYLLEQDPPAGEKPVEWMLLSSLPASSLDQAMVLIGYYTQRWIIEEWHRCLKQGCRLEDSQLDHADDIKRLSAILSVQATRLMQLRDLADLPDEPAEKKTISKSHADGKTSGPSIEAKANVQQTLKQIVPPLYLLIAAQLANVKPEQLTPRLFMLTIAKRGGYLARKHDYRPGWIVLWRGWSDIVKMAQGIELYQASKNGD